MPSRPREEPSRSTIERAGAGEAEAIAGLWRVHNPALLRYFRGRLPASAEDLAQQTWLDAARGLRRFRGDEDDFRRWLFTIGHRRLVDELRRRARRPEAPDDVWDERAVDDPNLAVPDDLDWALALVRRLPDDQADAVLLRVVADLDVAQVAEIMGRTPGSVRVLVHRGLRHLQELVDDDVTGLRRSAMNGE